MSGFGLLSPLLFSATAFAQALPSIDDIPAQVPDRPKWEVGIGALAFITPNYPASDDYRTLAFPAPYFVYRGRVLQADDEGSRLRHRFTPNIELGFSGGGALSSNSNDSGARRGMPDLDYLVEAGPNLRLSFDGPTPRSKLQLDLPVRAVFSVGSDLRSRGFTFAPELAFMSSYLRKDRLTLRLSLGSDWATEALHDYFYEVEPRYAIEGQRPAYSASAGYLGSSIGTRLTYAFTPRVSGFAAVRYYQYSGAANENSPLFERDDNTSLVVGFIWSLWQSRARAEDREP
jgi:outer membrane protein